MQGFAGHINSVAKKTKMSPSAILAFIASATLYSLLVVTIVLNKSSVEKLQMEQLIAEKSLEISDVISRLLYKTEALAAIVVQGDGNVSNFHRVAATLVDDPAILNVLIAPDGVVSDVYPLAGNESVIGLNYFDNGAGNFEATLARDTGELVFGGPFELIQGGQALVGRLPVFNNTTDGKVFWGLVSVTLKYPDVLYGTGLPSLEAQGYSYEIWRISPDNGEKQIIAASQSYSDNKKRYIEKHIPILNADWYFRMASPTKWYNSIETWVFIFSGVFISCLVAFVTQNNTDLRQMKTEVENIARTDSLTGIYNRRYFMELAPSMMIQSFRGEKACFIIMFDLDKFKSINDTYGHAIGDKVLKEVSSVVSANIRQSDLFCRYGGEEFLLMATGVEESYIMEFVERLRRAIAEREITWDNDTINISASFGIAQVVSKRSLESTINCADKALYQAKSSGRNASVLYEEGNS